MCNFFLKLQTQVTAKQYILNSFGGYPIEHDFVCLSTLVPSVLVVTLTKLELLLKNTQVTNFLNPNRLISLVIDETDFFFGINADRSISFLLRWVKKVTAKCQIIAVSSSLDVKTLRTLEKMCSMIKKKKILTKVYNAVEAAHQSENCILYIFQSSTIVDFLNSSSLIGSENETITKPVPENIKTFVRHCWAGWRADSAKG